MTKIQYFRPLLLCAAVCVLPLTARADKQDARDWYTGASAAGAGAALIPTGVTQAAGAGALVGQGVGFMGMGVWDWWNKAPQNPNMNPQQQQQQAPKRQASIAPIIPSSNPDATELAVVADVNAATAAGNALLTDSRSVSDGLQLYYGAIADGNAAAASKQQLWTSQAFASLLSDVSDYRNSLYTLNAAVQGTSFAAVSASVSDLASLQTSIVNNGFPSDEQFVFTQANATPLELSLAQAEVGLATLTHVPSTGVTGANIFQGMADSLGEVNLAQLLPTSFTLLPVPEPSSDGMVLSGLIAGAYCARRRARSDLPTMTGQLNAGAMSADPHRVGQMAQAGVV